MISAIQPIRILQLARHLRLSFTSTMDLFRAYYGNRRELLKKVVPETVVIDVPEWGKLPIRTNGYDYDLFTQIFVREDYRIEATNVRRILDLGANTGLATSYLSRLFADAEIACVEPSPQNIPLLRQTVALNGIKARIFEAAVGAEQGDIDLYVCSKPDCTSIVPNEDAAEIVRVPLIPVPMLMEQMGWDSIDLLKIDVEGAEKFVLGKNNAWLCKVRIILGESHVNVDYPYPRLIHDLNAFGFSLETVIEETPDYGATFRAVNTRIEKAPARAHAHGV